MSRMSYAKALRRRKRQLKEHNKHLNHIWIKHVKFAVFFNNISINMLRLPSGLRVGINERHPVPKHDPTKSNKQRFLERRKRREEVQNNILRSSKS
jgi:hypothetical protein